MPTDDRLLLWPPDETLRRLVRDQRNRVLLIAGAGLAKALTDGMAPDWMELLGLGIRFCQEHVGKDASWADLRRRELRAGDFVLVAEALTQAMGGCSGGQFRYWLQQVFGSLKPTNARLGDAIRGLKISVATLNYDSVLANALDLEPITARQKALVDQFTRGTARGVLHIHGHFMDPESVVFGVQAYGQILQDPHFQTILHALDAAWSFVFVGCGETLADPNLSTLLKHIKANFSQRPDCHFFLCRDTEASEFHSQYPVGESNIKPISYGLSYSDLAPFLESLQVPTNIRPTNNDIRRGLMPADGFGGPRIAASRLMATQGGFLGRSSEIKKLWGLWKKGDVRIVSVVAAGGIGKTQLIKAWRLDFVQAVTIRAHGGETAKPVSGDEWVFDWTFQGEESADRFIKTALEFFGPADPTQSTGNMLDGETLANRVKQHRTLLILDGLEAFQYPPGPEYGRLWHRNLEKLLNGLLEGNRGLCVLTSRAPLQQMGFAGHSIAELVLPGLVPKYGAKLLRSLGGKGTQCDLEAASRDYWGNPKTLEVLGASLRDRFDGDVTRRTAGVNPSDEIGRIDSLIKTYVDWILTRRNPTDPVTRVNLAAVGILRILGLFEQPATVREMQFFRNDLPIPNLTDSVAKLQEADWQAAVGWLRRAQLITLESSGAIGTHPLIQVCLARQLKREYPEAWHAGHAALFQHFASQASEMPVTLEEMTPLYRAVHHACEAGLHAQGLEVFQRRIRRDDSHYSFFSLGAVMSDLGALAHFLKPGTWERLLRDLDEPTEATGPQQLRGTLSESTVEVPYPVDGLTPLQKAYVLNEVGSALRFMGYPLRAVPLIAQGMVWRRKEGDELLICRSARNLSKAYLQAGLFDEARRMAFEALKLAPKTLEKADSYISTSNVARILHFKGESDRAEQYYRKAEELRVQRHGTFTLQEAHYCEFLLDCDRVSDAEWLMQRFAKEPNPVTNVLNHGLYHYSIAKLYMARDLLEAAKPPLDIAVVMSLPRSLRLEELVVGYLTRACLNRRLKNLEAAKADLDRAFRLACHGGLKIAETDCHLEKCALYVAMGNASVARASLETARVLIDDMQYFRRRRLVASLASDVREASKRK